MPVCPGTAPPTLHQANTVEHLDGACALALHGRPRLLQWPGSPPPDCGDAPRATRRAGCIVGRMQP